MLCGRALPHLWSLLTRMRISQSVIWFKSVFHVCKDLLKTLHGLTKKKLRMCIEVIIVCICTTEHVSEMVKISPNLTSSLEFDP